MHVKMFDVRRSMLIVFVFLLLTNACSAQTEEAKAYDGLWFMGFNMHKDIFGDKDSALVRQAINMAIDRKAIVSRIIQDTVVPGGVIPPTMAGYDPDLKGYGYDLKKAKEMMRKAGYSTADPRLKNLVLLHTDGEKTVRIAKAIKNYLVSLGMRIELRQMPFADEKAWWSELDSGRSHLFLMGFKADSAEDSTTLLQPLFVTGGEANFSYFSDSRVDTLLGQLSMLDLSAKDLREPKLTEIDKIILDQAPTVNLFYITKL